MLNLRKKILLVELVAVSILLILGLSVSQAAVTVTPASGGTSISADTFASSTFTSLGQITIAEGAANDIGIGTIILTVPSGFNFSTTTAPNAAVTAGNLAINTTTTVSATTITITVNATSTSASTLVIGNVTAIQVIPTAGTPLASGNILRTTGNPGTATVNGIVNGTTNFGTLTEVAGALNKLNVTLPGQTFSAGSGNSGAPSSANSGLAFNLTLNATDRFLNFVPSYSGSKTITYSFTPQASPPPAISGGTGSSPVSFASGSSTPASVTITIQDAYGNLPVTISVSDGTVSGPASVPFTIVGRGGGGAGLIIGPSQCRPYCYADYGSSLWWSLNYPSTTPTSTTSSAPTLPTITQPTPSSGAQQPATPIAATSSLKSLLAAFVNVVKFNGVVFGQQNDDIKTAQADLKFLNYFPQSIEASGYFGPITQKAVQDFQAANNLKVSGELDSATQQLLVQSVFGRIFNLLQL